MSLIANAWALTVESLFKKLLQSNQTQVERSLVGETQRHQGGDREIKSHKHKLCFILNSFLF